MKRIKNKQFLFLYLILMGVTFSFSYQNQNDIFSSTIFYFVWSLPFVSFVYTIFSFFRFSISQTTNKKRVTKGEVFSYNLNLCNNNIYPFVNILFYKNEDVFDKQLKDQNISNLYKGKCSYQLKGHTRGNYRIGVQKIVLEDFLGIFKFNYKVSQKLYVTIYPRIIDISYFPLICDATIDDSINTNKKFYQLNNNTISDIRKYNYGDSLSKIHWKLSSKKQEFLVKNFENTVESSTLVLLDTSQLNHNNKTNINLEDKMVEAATSIINYSLKNSNPVELIYSNDTINILKADNYNDFINLYELLADVTFSSDIPLQTVFELKINDKNNITNLIVITSKLTDKLCHQLIDTTKKDVNIILIYIDAKKDKNQVVEEYIKSLKEMCIYIYHIDINSELDELLECGSL